MNGGGAPPLVGVFALQGDFARHAAAWRADVIDPVHLIVAPTALGDGGVKVFDGIDVPMSALIPSENSLTTPAGVIRPIRWPSM